MMDSGGFRFQKRHDISADIDEIVDLYQRAKVDIGVVLDHPFDPNVSEQENGKRWLKTLTNLSLMCEKSNGDITLMPVIHGYTPRQY